MIFLFVTLLLSLAHLGSLETLITHAEVRYEVSEEALSFNASHQLCAEESMALSSIASGAEWDFLIPSLAIGRYWIGLQYVCDTNCSTDCFTSTNQWRWTDGSQITDSSGDLIIDKWGFYQPFSCANIRCAALNRGENTTAWEVNDCGSPLPYICKQATKHVTGEACLLANSADTCTHFVSGMTGAECTSNTACCYDTTSVPVCFAKSHGAFYETPPSDIDECLSIIRPHRCKHGTCQNTVGGYTCNCEAGYIGNLCDEANGEWSVYNGHMYYVADGDLYTFDDAQEQCEGLGAELTSITSQGEYDFILSKLTLDRYWIGLECPICDTQCLACAEGPASFCYRQHWSWRDGQPMTDNNAFIFEKWGQSQPDNCNNPNDCGAIKLPPEWWIDAACHSEFGFICKKAANCSILPEFGFSTLTVLTQSIDGAVNATFTCEQNYEYNNTIDVSSFSCVNNQWVEPPEECNDIDECSGSHSCDQGVCNNTEGGYTCECDTGYVGSFCNDSIGAWHATNENMYYISNRPEFTYDESQSICEQLDTNLTSISNVEEHNFLSDLVLSNRHWIGLECPDCPQCGGICADSTHDCYRQQWRWLDGSAMEEDGVLIFNKWKNDEPSSCVIRGCARVGHMGRWSYNDCDDLHGFICKRAPNCSVLPILETSNLTSLIQYDNGDVNATFTCQSGLYYDNEANSTSFYCTNNHWQTAFEECTQPLETTTILETTSLLQTTPLISAYATSESDSTTSSGPESTPPHLEATEISTAQITSSDVTVATTEINDYVTSHLNATDEIAVETTRHTRPPVIPPNIEPQDVICPLPPELEHSTLVFFRTDESDHSTAVYRCREGYYYDATYSTKLFQCTTGIWSPGFVDCSAIKCDIPDLQNAVLYGAMYSLSEEQPPYVFYGDVLSVVCQQGCVFPDHTTSISSECQNDGQWSTPLIGCIVDGDCEYDGDSYNIRDMLIRDCPEGLKNLYGLPYIQAHCLASNEWSTPTTCQADRCNPPPILKKTTLATFSVERGSTITYACDLGYSFPNGHTESLAECTEYGWSITDEGCTENACPVLPWISNVDVDDYSVFTRHSFQTGTQITLYAHTNYKFEDGSMQAVAICRSNGTWAGTDPPRENRCPPLPEMNHTLVAEDQLDVSLFATNRLVCERGYEFSDGSEFHNVTCQPGLQWEQDIPQCQAVQCPAIQTTENVFTNTSDTSKDTVVEIRCTEGYELGDDVTSIVTTCSWQATWTRDTNNLTCSMVSCPYPPVIGNATRSGTHSMLGAVVAYTCPRGYVISGSHDNTWTTIRCQSNKQWTTLPNACILRQCAHMPVWQGIVANTTANTYMTSVAYSCDEGYTFSDGMHAGEKQALCAASGEWVPAISNCTLEPSSSRFTVEAEPEEVADGFAYALAMLICLGLLLVIAVAMDTITLTQNLSYMASNLGLID